MSRLVQMIRKAKEIQVTTLYHHSKHNRMSENTLH